MKLDYFTLLSPNPIHFAGACSVKATKLSEISDITINVYNTYLSLLSMNIEKYYSSIDKIGDEYFTGYSKNDKQVILDIREEYDDMDSEQKSALSFFSIMIFDFAIRNIILSALNFFLVDEVEFDEKCHLFVTYNGAIDESGNKAITGCISPKNYSDIIDVIMQTNNIQTNDKKNELKFKSALAKEVWELTHKNKEDKIDKDMDMGNIISSVAAKSHSLNIINIWDLTVYQLYDQFQKLQGNIYFDIGATSVAVWGDEKGKFNGNAWYKNNFKN